MKNYGESNNKTNITRYNAMRNESITVKKHNERSLYPIHAVILTSGKGEKRLACQTFYDNGSDLTMILHSTAKRLKLEKLADVHVDIYTMANQSESGTTANVLYRLYLVCSRL